MKISIIIFLFPPKWLAGTEIATYNLSKQFAKRGHEIEVLTSHDEGLDYATKEEGFNAKRISWPKIRIIGTIYFWFRIIVLLRRFNPDIILVQSLEMGFPAFLIKVLSKKPYVIWGRGSDIYIPDYFVRMSRKKLLDNADAILALTSDMQKKIEEITSKNILVVPNAIDLTDINPNTLSYKNELDKKIITFVGSLFPVKGVQYLIRAMEKIHNQIPQTRLILVGDGNERFNLEKLSKELQLENCIEFIGRVPHQQVSHYLSQTDVFVLPSLSEGFPNVLLEAMAFGLPIVASRVGGIPDIIEDGTNGFLVEPKNVSEIADRILTILFDEMLAQKISAKNREEVQRYQYNDIIDILENIFTSILCKKQ